jgi:hypothetical protein
MNYLIWDVIDLVSINTYITYMNQDKKEFNFNKHSNNLLLFYHLKINFFLFILTYTNIVSKRYKSIKFITHYNNL